MVVLVVRRVRADAQTGAHKKGRSKKGKKKVHDSRAIASVLLVPSALGFWDAILDADRGAPCGRPKQPTHRPRIMSGEWYCKVAAGRVCRSRKEGVVPWMEGCWLLDGWMDRRRVADAGFGDVLLLLCRRLHSSDCRAEC